MGYVGPFPLPVSSGGTGDSTITHNAVLIGEATSAIGSTNVGTDGQVLIGATSGAPAFATLTSSGGTITYTTGANSLNLETSGTGTASAVTFMALSGSGGNINPGILVYLDGISGGIAVVKPADCVGTAPGNWPAVGVTVDTIQPAVSGRVMVSGIATGVNATGFSTGDRLFLSSSGGSGAFTHVRPTGNNAIQPVGTCIASGASGTVLVNITENVTLIPNLLANYVPVGLTGGTDYPSSVSLANGLLTYDTTGQAFSGSSITQNSLIYGSTSNTVSNLGVATNGQLPIGSTGSAPVLATITAGAGISVTNGAGSITISASSSGFTWTDVTGGSATLAAENGYIADSGSLTTFTMPTNNAIGDTIKIVGKGAGGWKIVYTTGQNIIMGSSASTATTGNIASTNANDCVELVCTTASATAPIFTVVSSIGNISIT